MKCYYCFTFHTVPASLRKLEGGLERKVSNRYCKEIDQYVVGEHEVCAKFVPNKYIYCNKLGWWIPIISCLYYHKIRHPAHSGCHQVEGIIDCVRGWDLHKLFGVKRKNGLSKNRTEPPIKLMRKGKVK